jgi:hypothetical protein
MNFTKPIPKKASVTGGFFNFRHMRLAFVLCIVCSSGFAQSFGVKQLYQVFTSTLPEANAFLADQGYMAFELGSEGIPTDPKAGLLYARSSWVNELGEQELWEYYLPGSLTIVGFYWDNEKKIIGDAACYQPKLDTVSIFKEIGEMKWEKMESHPGAWMYTNSDRSLVFMVTVGATGNPSLMSFLHRGDEMVEKMLSEYKKKNSKKSKDQ